MAQIAAALRRFLSFFVAAALVAVTLFLGGAPKAFAQDKTSTAPAQGDKDVLTELLAEFTPENDPRAPAEVHQCRALIERAFTDLTEARQRGCEPELNALAQALKPNVKTTKPNSPDGVKRHKKRQGAKKAAVAVVNKLCAEGSEDPFCKQVADLIADQKAFKVSLCGTDGAGCGLNEGQEIDKMLGWIGYLRDEIDALKQTDLAHTARLDSHGQRITKLEEQGSGGGLQMNLHTGFVLTFSNPIWAKTIQGDKNLHLVKASQAYFLTIGPEFTQPTSWGKAVARLSLQLGLTGSSDPNTGDAEPVFTVGSFALAGWLFPVGPVDVGPVISLGGLRGGDGAQGARFVTFQAAGGVVVRISLFELEFLLGADKATTEALGVTEGASSDLFALLRLGLLF